MVHLPYIIKDLALILCTAGGTILLFKKLKQPVVLGYIIAGLIISPNVSLFPSIIEIDNINIWAEMGVIFLLFSLGLEFSFKKLMKVGGGASLTAIVEVISMLFIGYTTGQILGWNHMDSIFLGGILSISSTTIIIRAFEELGIKSKKFVSLVFGVLIVEDLVAILLLALLSSLSISKHFSGDEMLQSGIKLVFFLVLWFISGIFLIPTFLKRISNIINEEILLIVALGLCLGMVVIATKAGFSPALGAFVMGSILAETTAAEKIEHLIKSVKDLFGAVFFVSVGMLINPNIIYEYGGPILLITIITILGKIISSTCGALLSGQPLKHSLQGGMSLAQIGEFSFIIATLGLTLKVTSEFLYPIAVAVSGITTFTTPYLIKIAEPTCIFIDKLLPEKIKQAMARYSAESQKISRTDKWKPVITEYIYIILINSVIIIGLLLLSVIYLKPFFDRQFPESMLRNIGEAIFFLLIMAPFLWALSVKKINNPAYSKLWLELKSKGPLIMLEILRILLATLFISFLLSGIFPKIIAISVSFIIVIAVGYIFSKKLQTFYGRIENRFLSNLNERDNHKDTATLLPWDTHLSSFVIQPETHIAGKTLEELSLRERFGINIAAIERGRLTYYLPSKDQAVYPGDRLSVIGTDEQLSAFRAYIDQTIEPSSSEISNVGLIHIVIEKRSSLLGKTIRNSKIREEASCMVVGIERNNERILNPHPDIKILENDVLWLAGDPKYIKSVNGKI